MGGTAVAEAPHDLDGAEAFLIEHKAHAAAVGGAVDVIEDADDPLVFTIVGAVTGVEDEVKDIILPGACSRSLSIRNPKVIKDHAWDQRLGTPVWAKELHPGDPGLPKRLPNGKPWPREAGALLVKVRLFDSVAGREAAARWRQEGSTQQFSIGYVARKATKRKDGVRLIADMDVLEVSDVLWGAMPLCGIVSKSLAAKMADAVSEAAEDAIETLDDPVDSETGVDAETAAAFEAALHRMAEAEIDWAEVDAAGAAYADATGTAAKALDWASVATRPAYAPEVKRLISPAEYRLAAKAGASLPDGSWPVLTEMDLRHAIHAADGESADVKAHVHKRAVALDRADLIPPSWATYSPDPYAAYLPEGKAGGADRDRGNAEQLRRYWTTGPGGARIGWNTDGAWRRCVAELSEHMGERAKGYCFTGDTEFLTRDGITTFAEAVDTEQMVLTADAPTTPNARAVRRDGHWVQAPIRSYGEQHVLSVTLVRNRVRKVIRATPEHVWFATTGGQVRVRGPVAEVTTANLRPGMNLAALLPAAVTFRSTPSPFGIAAGFVFGDGHRETGKGCRVDLWGEKDASLLPLFDGCSTAPVKTANGVLGTRVSGLPASWKSAPSLDEGTAHLFGWLAGYIAADGSVSQAGRVELFSARRSDLEYAATIATRLGISTYGITSAMRVGYGSEPTALYRLSFIGGTVPTGLLVIPEHRRRFVDASDRRDIAEARGGTALQWRVKSVEDHGEAEEVFCAEVPDTATFALTEQVWVHNCQLRKIEMSGAAKAWADATGLRLDTKAAGKGEQSCKFCDQRATKRVTHGEKSTMVCAKHVKVATRFGSGKAKVEDIDAAKPAGKGEKAAIAGALDVDAAVAVAAAPDHSTGVMVAVYPHPEDAAALAVDGGLPEEELHVTLAYLGDVTDALGDGTKLGAAHDRITRAVEVAAAKHDTMEGQIGGLGVFPPSGDGGTPTWVPWDVPGLSALREHIVEALDAAGVPARTDHGFAPHMTLGYDLGETDVVEPRDVKVDRVTIVIGESSTDVALGRPTTKAAAWDPLLEVGDHAAHRTVQAKDFPNLDGTYEARLATIRAAVLDIVREQNPPDENEAHVHCEVHGTFDDHAIVSVSRYSDGGSTQPEHFTVPYRWADGDVTVGEPEPVTLTVEVGQDDADEMIPDVLTGAADTVKRLLLAAPETKVGRVLSGRHADRLRAAVEHLLAVLHAAGVEIVGPTEITTPNRTDPSVTDSDTTAPAARVSDRTATTRVVAAKTHPTPDVPDVEALLAAVDAHLAQS